ncbi:hypothetical protein [Aestuariimicrobium ganziense]|uniref:hypothetical protein n=1 Tax=Aestuariimicrobium ganziense TaxID=2773677 RepID=UPI0019418844|nr:hypothetical protein [Aestuariimicrobium ganziense]
MGTVVEAQGRVAGLELAGRLQEDPHLAVLLVGRHAEPDPRRQVGSDLADHLVQCRGDLLLVVRQFDDLVEQRSRVVGILLAALLGARLFGPILDRGEFSLAETTVGHVGPLLGWTASQVPSASDGAGPTNGCSWPVRV